MNKMLQRKHEKFVARVMANRQGPPEKVVYMTYPFERQWVDVLTQDGMVLQICADAFQVKRKWDGMMLDYKVGYWGAGDAETAGRIAMANEVRAKRFHRQQTLFKNRQRYF